MKADYALNLMDEQAFPAHVWGVEENDKHLKQWVEIENFSGKSVVSVKQDFYVEILTSNLTAMVANAVQKKIGKITSTRQHAC